MVLAVPDTAVIDTGSQTIVYRESSPGVYEGVKVELGPKMTGPEAITFYPVLGGLERGEHVSQPAHSWSMPKLGSIQRPGQSISVAVAGQVGFVQRHNGSSFDP